MEQFKVTDEYVQETALRRWGFGMTRTGTRHWNSPCPKCGGTDRFYVTAIGRFECNKCDFSGWLDDDQKFRPDPLLEEHRKEAELKRKQEQEQRWRDWTNGFLAGFYWREWHDRMGVENIQWWESQGISREQVDFYELGYLREKQIKHNGGTLTLPAYTIPVREPESWEICNIHYRLVNPPSGVQKYRYEHGLEAREFYAEKGTHHKSVIAVEGAKKAMVVYRYMDGATQVVGLTSCAPGEEMLRRLERYSQVFLCLDPGCKTQEQRIKKILPNTRIVRAVAKPDDMFLMGMTKREFSSLLYQSR